MSTGSVPLLNTPLPRSARSRRHRHWLATRLGVTLIGLAWIVFAATLCGCNMASGWVYNQSGERRWAMWEEVFRSGQYWKTAEGWYFYGSPTHITSTDHGGWDSYGWLQSSVNNTAGLGRMWGWW